MQHVAGGGEAGISEPLCVDLDGTLVATDLLWESIFVLLRTRPWDIARVPAWLSGGRANLKHQLAERVELNVADLPYRPEVLAFLHEQKRLGRRLVLATASAERPARAVAAHLGIFDCVLATTETANLKGAAKLAQITAKFGAGAFDYLGDSRADLPIWKSSRRAFVVKPSRRLLEEVKALGTPYEVIPTRGTTVKDLTKEVRLHQWAKNVLIGVPLVTSHQVLNPTKLGLIALAFFAFSFVASAVYVLNDLLDLEADRRHPRKRYRPLAAGRISIPAGIGLLVVLAGAGLGIACFLPGTFAAWLLFYAVLTTAYSFYLKRKMIVDVMCLAALYSLRIMAGGAVTDIPISPWLMAFSMFLFLSLALAKRCTELSVMTDTTGLVSGRGYLASDIELVRSVGPAMGGLSVLVMCLYLNSPDVLKLYRNPFVLWLACPILLYWILRIWFLAHRRQLIDDPVSFALTDGRSLLAGALIALIIAVATLY